MTPIRLARATLPLIAVLAAAPAEAQQGAAADSAALVTVLGADTLALERWVRTPTRVTAEAVVRAPRTTLRRYVMELAPDGSMRRFEERIYDPSNPDTAVRSEIFEAGRGGWTRTVADGDSVLQARIEGAPTALPFVDLVHWPYETVLMRAMRGGAAEQPLLAGSRAIPFTVTRDGEGWIVRHPLRGPMTARVDASGRLLSMDASGTTRKVVVTRVPWLALDSAAARWAAADRAGRGIGDLSGRGREESAVAGARIMVDYGTPMVRGREIFGRVVPWGQVWRTGANRATHFSTTRALVLGEGASALEVPAGEYTLFSVPAEDGGVLIVNRQTGQNGTSYDAARDLGRVPMRRAAAADLVERFTIEADATGGQSGAIRILWDRSEFRVPFTVR
jgi:hypothetical protein